MIEYINKLKKEIEKEKEELKNRMRNDGRTQQGFPIVPTHRQEVLEATLNGIKMGLKGAGEIVDEMEESFYAYDEEHNYPLIYKKELKAKLEELEKQKLGLGGGGDGKN